jgi:hypothetical protein
VAGVSTRKRDWKQLLTLHAPLVLGARLWELECYYCARTSRIMNGVIFVQDDDKKRYVFLEGSLDSVLRFILLFLA